jgi:N-acetylglucosamine kinase-like BadF-type ATPase
MRYFLGIDGGNSKTFALVGDEMGRIISLGRGGNSNHQAAGGVARAMACIAEAVSDACRQASITYLELSHACFCIAGADLPSDHVLLTDAIRAQWPGLAFSVRNDSFAGLRAGAVKGWGVVSIAGSGSNQAGIAPDGRALQVGGLGYVFGDFGGGADLGREALRAVFMAAELRGPATVLTGPVLGALGVGTVDELREGLYLRTVAWGQIYLLAPLVFEAANQGDLPAQEILMRMGTLLGQSVCGVIRQLDLGGDAVDVVLAGSTWKGSNPLMMNAFRLAVQRVAPRARLVRPRYEPVVGAWCLALEAVGIRVLPAVYRMVEATLPVDLPVHNEEGTEWLS